MPELAEVEAVRSQIERRLTKITLTAAIIDHEKY